MCKDEELSPGDFVVLRDHTTEAGEVLKITGKYATIAFERLSMRIPLTALKKTTRHIAPPGRRPTKAYSRVDDFCNFEPTIDLHGLSAQEAIQRVDKWMDEGFLLGHKQFKIIHGKGAGILRSAVRDYLYKHKQVKKVLAKHPYAGGDGITCLELH